jgi:hypothetical protein
MPWSDTALAARVCEALAQLHDSRLLPRETFSWNYEDPLIRSADETLEVATSARDVSGRRVWRRLADLRRVVAALPPIRRRLLSDGVTVIQGDIHQNASSTCMDLNQTALQAALSKPDAAGINASPGGGRASTLVLRGAPTPPTVSVDVARLRELGGHRCDSYRMPSTRKKPASKMRTDLPHLRLDATYCRMPL